VVLEPMGQFSKGNLWNKVDRNGIAGPPVKGCLKGRRTAQARGGKEDVFAEGGLSAGDQGIDRNTRQVVKLLFQAEPVQGWGEFDALKAELLGDLVAKVGGAHLGDGKATRGDD